jgi:ABC-type phosphate transport system substrate-binding protein
MNRRLCLSISLLAATGALLSASDALAANCVDLPNPVYVTGSSAAKPLLALLGPALTIGNPAVTIVYRSQGSCLGIDAILHDTLLTGAGMTAASYWDAAGTEQKCDIDAAGVKADIGLSDVFATTCYPGESVPNTISDFPGPVQTMTFVVPGSSTQKSISAEAAYLVFGFGNTSGVTPWDDETLLFQRGPTSGTQQMIATAIGVPAASWRGVVGANGGAIVSSLLSCPTPEKCVGILATDVAQTDANLASLRILAYQHHGQSCGYFPDSDVLAKDKQNVRDGHYEIWGPLHILTHVSVASGDPVNADAKVVIDSLTGAVEVPNQDFINVQWINHVVPQCAMRVRRTEEVGPLASFMPTRSCGCKYDALAGKKDCQACTGAADCPATAPACNFGFCEVQ